jgi:superfamily II DNA or RNA helicase
MPSTHPRLKTLPTDLFTGLQSFRELEDRISALPDGSLLRGDALEVFVEAHLQTSPLFQVEELWLVNQIPLSVRRQLGLENDSAGIDGVYRTGDGTLVPYQVKFREGRPQVGVGDTSSFFMLTDNAAQRILISNSDRYSNKVRDRKNLQIIGGLYFDEFTAEDFARIHSWLKNKPVIPRRERPLRPHQARAVDAIVSRLRSETRATAVMPCGTGKTLVGLRVVEELKPRNVVVFVPSLALLAQLLEDWAKDTTWGKRFRYLCVCSQPAVSAEVDRWELNPTDVHFPVNTNPAVVRDFLNHDSGKDIVRVVFSTYQSARKVADGLPRGFRFDVGLFDEAHKTTEGGFGLALEDRNLPIDRRLFLTATPRHIDIKHRNKQGDFKVVSMDNPEVYGQRAFSQSFPEAVEEGIICDYRVVVATVDRSEVSEYAERYGITLVQDNENATRWVASQIAVTRAIEETGASKVITFHSRVRQAKDFASQTSRGIGQFLPDFAIGHVNGTQPITDRKDILSGFRGDGKMLVTNARCLTEGVDLPAVDAVVFNNPRRSKADIVQAVGRAMRKPPHSKKELGYVVIPVLLEQSQTDDLEEACRGTEWEDLVAVLAALRDQDSRLDDIICEAQEAAGRGEVFDPRPFRDQITILGRPQIPLSIVQRHVDAVILERLGQTWDYRYGQMQAHKAERGHCDIPWDYNDKSLYDWTTRQRIARKKDRLSDDQIARLDRIGFDWDPFGNSFAQFYYQLERHKETYGNCDVLVKTKGLGQKLGQLRTKFRKKLLSQDRIDRLLALGAVLDPSAEKFETMFSRLARHHELHGNCNVSSDTKRNGDLLMWMAYIRGRKKQGKLSAEQIFRLDAIGFLWSPKGATQTLWNQRMSEMAAYIAENGDSDVPLAYPANQDFAKWWRNTRSSRNRGKLNKQKERELDALGVTWSLDDSKWNSMFEQLKLYKKKFGDCKVPPDYTENPKLGRWVRTQLYERGKNIKRRNTAERVRILASIGFWDDWAC